MPRRPVALLALALTASLAACSDAGSPVARPAPSTSFTAGEVPVIVPGAPGEQATVLQPGQTGALANSQVYDDADVAFVTGMVPHHAQALEMARLAPQRAADPRVRALAERIAVGQGPEIEVMQAWLAQQGLPAASTDAGHGGGHSAHGGMQGMASPVELTRLLAAQGGDFDRLFLQLMTRHHEGALRMAQQAVGARHPVISELVEDVYATQSAEIRRMQEVLATLPA